MLKACLYELGLQKREAERLEAEATRPTSAGLPDPVIRAAALSDGEGSARTGVERSDPQKVLDGDLDEFMAASLAARVGEGGDKQAA